MTSKIHYTKPSITALETAYAADAVATGWGEKCYDYINRFEAEFRAHLGTDFAIATSSCTGAMHMGLSALGVGVGDEVILADTNWIATAAPIVHLGASPVFVDVLETSWCIDPMEVIKAITPRTKAIIATHIYGNLCDMDALLEISRQTGIPVIEDAAEAIGSKWAGKRAGSMGLFGTFSFHGTKTMTTGEGGMFVTSDADFYEKVLTLSNHGRARGQTQQFWPDEVGFKYKMSNVQAAIGCAQLERVEELVARKREILHTYMLHLSSVRGISMNPDYYENPVGAWMPTAVFHPDAGVTREMLQHGFKAANIDARVFFHPLSSLSFFKSRPENVNAWSIPNRAINLPSYHDMTEADITRVSATLVEIAAATKSAPVLMNMSA